ncbi:hypothetical protein F5Y18DRAFT_432333 [Xylariaceae sp. FL1019]|nr:hypothetical protein F5Y18DRAFT_432333 [Xylariaceae sp. FL1019]
MQFSIVPLMAFAAMAQGAVLEARAFSGCTIQLESTVAEPSGAGELIDYGILNKWVASTGSTDISSAYFTGTTQAPFSVSFPTNTIAGYETNEELEAVLDPWVGTYLWGGATPDEDNLEDFLITAVDCV